MRSRSTSTACPTGQDVVIGGLLQHIEEAGIHSGDSSMALPGPCASTRRSCQVALFDAGARARARCRWLDERSVRGSRRAPSSSSRSTLARASRTIPFISKAIGVPTRQGRRQGDGGCQAPRDWLHPRGSSPITSPSKSRSSRLRQVSRRRHDPQPRDALDREKSWGSPTTSPTRSTRHFSPRTWSCPTRGRSSSA